MGEVLHGSCAAQEPGVARAGHTPPRLTRPARRWRVIAVLLVILMVAGAVNVMRPGFAIGAGAAVHTSSNIAYVFDFGGGVNDPNSDGSSVFTNAITGSPPGSGDSATYGTYTLTNVPLSTLEAHPTSALTGFDTVLMYMVCSIGDPANAAAMGAINSFIDQGGKLIILDGDRCNDGDGTTPNYGTFRFPFKSNNPGPHGASGSYSSIEASSLTNGLTVGPQEGDAVGDANVLTTYDPAWFAAIKATNVTGATGPVEAYARTASGGLVLFEGEDFWAAYITAHVHQVFDLLLGQQWNPDHLPGTQPIAGGGAPIGGPIVSLESLGNGNLCWSCTAKGIIQALVGRPVNTATGNFTATFRDIATPGRGLPIDFNRTYNSLVASTDSPLGFGWAFSYGVSLTENTAMGQVTIHQENASQVTFTPSGSGSYSAPPRFMATLVKNTDGSFTFTRHARETMLFSPAGLLLKERDLNGSTTTFSYDSRGRLIAVIDPAGRTLTLRYDGHSHISRISDPMGRTVTFDYDDGHGNLTDVEDVNGGHERFTYDAQHRMVTMTDPKGGTVTNHYDTSNRVDWQSDELGRKTSFAYTGDPTSTTGGTTAVTDPKGNVTLEAYQFGEKLTETKGFGTSQAAAWHYSYVPATLGIMLATDPNGHAMTATYDSQGNPLTLTDALGRTTVNTWDALSDLTSTTDPMGVKTTMVYDARGNLLSRSRPLVSSSHDQVSTYHHDDPAHPGDLTSMVDPNGKTWRYGYDADGDQMSTTDPLGNTTTWRYNVLGWLTATISPNGNVHGADHDKYQTTLDHNLFGQVTEVTDPLGSETVRHYDDNGNLVMSRDAGGNVTRYTYDAANELKAIIRPNGTTFATDYNPDGTVFHQIDGKGKATTYRYDALARVTSVTDPLGRATSVTYDGVGNLRTVTDPQAQVTTYSYDSANELISIAYSDGSTPNVSHLTYDADGQRLTMTDGSGTSTDHYDSLNRLTSSTDGAGNTVAYGYDLNGQLTALTYPGGHVVTREFDPAGRLMTVKDWLGNMTRFGYDPSSNLTTEAFPASTRITDTFRYDAANRLMGIVDARAGDPFATFTYRRDRNGQVISEGDKGVPGGPDTYAYNGLNQLSGANTKTYAYDAADNLTKLLNGSTLAYDAANELTALTNGTTTTTFSYDPRGNRTAISRTGSATTSLKYDQANRLTSYGTSATYTYDGDGLRTSKKVGTSTSPFVWDRAEGLPLLLTDGGTFYIYGPGGLPLEQIIGDTAYWYHHDQLGSTRVLTDSSGAIKATYTFNAYGNINAATGSVTNPFKFAGEYQDSESGMYYLRARYYDPTTAQFITRDPAIATTRSPYGYVDGNPLNAKDPDGLKKQDPQQCGLAVGPTCDNNGSVGNWAAFIAGIGKALGNMKLCEAGDFLGHVTSVTGGVLAGANDAMSHPELSPPVAIAHGVATGGGFVAGAELGAGVAAAGCAMTVVGAPFAPVCGLAGGLFGGLIGAWAGSTAADGAVQVGNSINSSIDPEAPGPPISVYEQQLEQQVAAAA